MFKVARSLVGAGKPKVLNTTIPTNQQWFGKLSQQATNGECGFTAGFDVTVSNQIELGMIGKDIYHGPIC